MSSQPRGTAGAQPEVSDGRLLEQIAGGDERALLVLYDRYSAREYGLARRITGDFLASQEILQEVLLEVWRQAERLLTTGDKLVPWLLTVTHHKSVDWLRANSRRRRREVMIEADDFGRFSPPNDQPVDRANRVSVTDALERLPTKERKLLYLKKHSSVS